MTAPRWITEAIEAAYDNGPGDGKLAAALIERLPLEAMVDALLALPFPDGGGSLREEAAKAIGRVAHVLTDGDPEVVELTELYQGATRALDAAGVPYAVDVEVPPHILIEAMVGETAPHKPAEVHHVSAHHGTLHLWLADRIRWLAQQRPTRLDLQRVEAERDRTQKELAECRMILHGHQQRVAELERQLVEKSRPDGATP